MQARAAAVKSAFGPALRPNRTGLPDSLKAGVEAASGLSMDDVRVTKNSPKPAQLQALACARGTEIHLGPGQEQHLPHEARHVVQQKQGRVKPTLQMKGVAINDEGGLEREADAMASRAFPGNGRGLVGKEATASRSTDIGVAQLYTEDAKGVAESQNQNYRLNKVAGNSEVYAKAAATAPLYSTAKLSGKRAYPHEYTPNDKFIADCLHTAEEIMNNKRLKEGGIHSQAKDAVGDFGDSNVANSAVAMQVNANHSNENATPDAGEAFAIVQDSPIADDCYYHAAAVVAVDGSDRVTLEIFGNTGAGARKEDGKYNIYDSDPTSGATFHDEWSQTFTSGAITIALKKK